MLEVVDAPVVLEKFAGKGGWTYAPVPGLAVKSKTHFGIIKVSGQVDGVALENVALMPMGQGRRFLPVNAALRKQLGKQTGDTVHLRLFAVEKSAVMAVSMADFKECLAEVPAALHAFEALGAPQQQALFEQVASADEEEQVARIEAVIAQLVNLRKKF